MAPPPGPEPGILRRIRGDRRRLRRRSVRDHHPDQRVGGDRRHRGAAGHRRVVGRAGGLTSFDASAHRPPAHTVPRVQPDGCCRWGRSIRSGHPRAGLGELALGRHLPASVAYTAVTHFAGSTGMSLDLWVNDGLMAIFFFVVGLEIKRELRIGELAIAARAALPVSRRSADGGARPHLPALDGGEPEAGLGNADGHGHRLRLGVLALVGPRVPIAQGLPARARHRRRPGGGAGHRVLLHRHPSCEAAGLALRALYGRIDPEQVLRVPHVRLPYGLLGVASVGGDAPVRDPCDASPACCWRSPFRPRD